MEKKIKRGKQFYPVRTFRLSNANYADLKELKRGTWNYTLKCLIELNNKNKWKNKKKEDITLLSQQM